MKASVPKRPCKHFLPTPWGLGAVFWSKGFVELASKVSELYAGFLPAFGDKSLSNALKFVQHSFIDSMSEVVEYKHLLREIRSQKI